MGPTSFVVSCLLQSASAQQLEEIDDTWAVRSYALDAEQLDSLPPESFGAPAWRLLGPADAPWGALGPTLQWNGVTLAGHGDPLPIVPIGTVRRVEASAAPVGGATWAPGARTIDVDFGMPRGGALQVGWPTPRAVGRISADAPHGLAWGAAADVTAEQGSGMATLTATQDHSVFQAIGTGSRTPDGSDALVGASMTEDHVGSTVAMMGRVYTDERDQRLYRVGVSARLHRHAPTGLSAGAQVEHWGRNSDLTRRVGLWAENSQRSTLIDVVAGARLELQDRTGASIEERADVSPRLHVRLHTPDNRTGAFVGFSRSATTLAPTGQDLPQTDQLVAGVDQRLLDTMTLRAAATWTRIGEERAQAVDVGLIHDAEHTHLTTRVSAGRWTEGGQGLPWAAAMAVASTKVEVVLPLRLGVAGRWRSPGEAPAPLGAVGWLDGERAPHADLGGRAVASLPVGRASQRVELELSSWSRALQLPLLPRDDGRGDRLRPLTTRIESAIRYAW
ncbi:MAG: hypothetical protein KTR31_06310 [Myxococcales bacterium]|nr:hypothetical protein [Myxococcales bacterium]